MIATMDTTPVLFDLDALVKPLPQAQCRTCKFCERFYYGKRWLFAACGRRGRGKRNWRIKATQQACREYKNRNND